MGKIVINMVIRVQIFEHEDLFFFLYEWTQTLTCKYTLKKEMENLFHLSIVSSCLVSKFAEVSRRPFL